MNSAHQEGIPMSHGRVEAAEKFVSELVRQQTPSGAHDAQASLMEKCREYVEAAASGITVSGGGRDYPWMLLSTGTPEGGILFVCHADTVPEGDHQGWTFPPYSGAMTETALHGRGSVDMKGGMVAALEALVFGHHHGKQVAVLLTSDEEVGSLGASDCADSLAPLSPALLVVPEATENRVALGHRGATWMTLTARGRAAHGSTPEKGTNAIEMLSSSVIHVLEHAPRASDDYLGTDSVNIGTIVGGIAPNIVPAEAQLSLDFRTVAGGSSALRWAACRHPDISVRTVLDLPAVRTASIPNTLADFDVAPAAAFFTDASALQRVFPGIPTVIWGPGDPAQMHSVNERLERESFRQALSNYQTVVESL